MAQIKTQAARIAVRSMGEKGHVIVMLPSLGRGSIDFDALAYTCAKAGWRVILPEPRGIGESVGPMDKLTLHDLAADIAAVIRDASDAPVVLLGHAFGNRLARCVASDYPDLVSQLVLIASGGLVPIKPDILKAMIACIDTSRPDLERLPALQKAFFAQGSDPSVWLGGWWPDAATSQSAAVRATPVEDWWEAGGKKMLVLQADEDAIAPRTNSDDIKLRLGERVRIVYVPKAGHAMLPEQPDFIASAVLDHLVTK